MSKPIIKEITPLTKADCFTLFSRFKTEFDFPLHYHEEYELNFIENAAGAQRVVGDDVEEIEDLELVLVGSNVRHAWFTHKSGGKKIHEITIQFHKDLFSDIFLKRNQLGYIRTLFDKAQSGILFSRDTIERIAPRIKNLEKRSGFDSVLELMSILHDLSTSRNIRVLAAGNAWAPDAQFTDSRRIEKVVQFMNENFGKAIRLGEAAKIAGMTETAFSRFFKAKTGITFVDCLNDIRLGHASRMLIDTTNSIAEIAYDCGFNSISNFNRIFKKKKGSRPKEFRQNYSNTGTRIFI
ncbi:helix-turn-helix domain-containing protein [Dinghuibacter silviterrae]|uniref:AraC-like DNA-binding protein n=1 Tax=Dinghuibacter silviterrae TaxID=1539049 RepID=A0A4R8DVE8_9BACT|nr:AraC family transcriptional regulator [Dinghuibacter silviterrae]TDX02404.1 AraC-like DNA-binding protein [Dinghuibacter silviterrae]